MSNPFYELPRIGPKLDRLAQRYVSRCEPRRDACLAMQNLLKKLMLFDDWGMVDLDGLSEAIPKFLQAYRALDPELNLSHSQFCQFFGGKSEVRKLLNRMMDCLVEIPKLKYLEGYPLFSVFSRNINLAIVGEAMEGRGLMRVLSFDLNESFVDKACLLLRNFFNTIAFDVRSDERFEKYTGSNSVQSVQFSNDHYEIKLWDDVRKYNVGTHDRRIERFLGIGTGDSALQVCFFYMNSIVGLGYILHNLKNLNYERLSECARDSRNTDFKELCSGLIQLVASYNEAKEVCMRHGILLPESGLELRTI